MHSFVYVTRLKPFHYISNCIEPCYAASMDRAGFVLTGGKSSRMGSDKALLAFRGKPLAAYVAEVVASVCGRVVLIGSIERYGGLGYPVWEDRLPGCGPLGGIVTALEKTEADLNMVVACDMPGITAEFLAGLFESAAGVDAVIPRAPDGRWNPLCAVYHRRAYPSIEEAFGRGVRKVAAALEGLNVRLVDVTDSAPLHNVNTPEDWRTAG